MVWRSVTILWFYSLTKTKRTNSRLSKRQLEAKLKMSDLISLTIGMKKYIPVVTRLLTQTILYTTCKISTALRSLNPRVCMDLTTVTTWQEVFSTDASLPGTTHHLMPEKGCSRNLVKDEHWLIFLDGGHRCKEVELLKADRSFSWKKAPLCGLQIMPRGEGIKQAEAIKLSRMLI